ncbi:DNA repair protein recA 2 mitochondrial isoform X1 [Tripterygium wilfordii]|uniref:DNA repair protein recA 2 mitochondrial isoform X1 n=1 Tax=Tripterygium wilfordii TaxID=458696 RepID=A0A7J7DP29_TRIWF|nr:DNA repair protein recA homolog 2, mitochondrial [Tripterygium wilfordii]KAF5747964.1 DNA repair protein recA 2 mitochondrial isoform X1 [Tripterygium wilfordii]
MALHLSSSSSLVQSLRISFLRGSRLSSILQNRRRGQSICFERKNCNLSSLVEVSDFECDELQDDAVATEKATALRSALTQLADEFGKESKLSLQRFFNSRHAPVISTGSLKLDLALGIGGLPKGRIVEIYGKEASGKTTLALHIIMEAQKLGGCCTYLDVENAFDPFLAESMGVDTENLLIARPSSAENLLSVVDTLTKSGSADVIVVDSVAALVPQYELDNSIGYRNGDVHSRIMTQALRKIHSSLCRSQTLIVFVNQVRSKPRQNFGSLEVTSGGNALKFYSAVRLRMIRTGLLKTEETISGLGICVEVVKNKLAPAMKKAELKLAFGKGFCGASEVLDLASEHGIIGKEGSKFLIDGEFFSDTLAAEQYLTENSCVLDNIVIQVRRKLFERNAHKWTEF